ncbi:MAG: SH3 domain-containing protein [Thermomicrobiales bacterium]
MKRNDTTPVVIGRVWSLAITLMLLLSVLPALASPVAAQGTVTLTVTTVAAESGTPMPFVRIRATSSDGTVYGPRETGLPGTVSFDIDVTSAEMTVTVDVETPIACGVMPDPQVIGPFVGGETPAVNFSIATDPNCDLGTLAVYAYDCPDGFDATATDYQTWSTGCAEVRNNVQFTFTMLSNNQTWTPVTGQWGLPARAPIVGLPPGAYTMQESNPAPGQDSVFFCYVYATPDFVTSPNPTSIDRVDAPGGVATVNLNNNRISCDVFQVDAPEEGSEPTATSEGDGQVIVPPVAIGTATTLDELNLRAGPSGDAEILLEMPAGVTVEILGDPQNGFYPVRYQGQDGWAGGDFLGFGQEPPQPTATDVTEVQPAEPTATETTQAVAPILPVEPVGSATTTSDVNLRDAPTATGSNVLLVLPGRAVVDLLGDPENGFYPVRYNGQSGWVSGDFLQINAEGGEEPTATATATIGVLPTATAVDVPNPDSPVGSAVTNDSVNFRNGPSSDAAVLFELPEGAAVDLLGDALNGFFPVLFEGQGGWVSEIFLDVVPPTATATATSEPTFTATAQPTQTTAPIGVAFTTSDVNMRSAPDVGSAILTVLLPNTQVDLLGAEVNGFLPIRYNGQDGFVSAQFMSIGAPATATATIGAAAEDSATLELHNRSAWLDMCRATRSTTIVMATAWPMRSSSWRVKGAAPGRI